MVRNCKAYTREFHVVVVIDYMHVSKKDLRISAHKYMSLIFIYSYIL